MLVCIFLNLCFDLLKDVFDFAVVYIPAAAPAAMPTGPPIIPPKTPPITAPATYKNYIF